MRRADQHQLRIFQRQPPPDFEQMMHALPLDQRADENRDEFFRRFFRRREARDIHPALMPEQLLPRDARREKRLLRLLRKHEDEVREIVLLEHLLPGHEQPVL